jgi:RNA polymerase sigma factor (sigma-70 family)
LEVLQYSPSLSVLIYETKIFPVNDEFSQCYYKMKAPYLQSMSNTQSIKIADIFNNYKNKLFNFIRPRVKNEEDAEDILQEVFYELSEAESLMQPIERVSSWLYTVARNRIIDLYRKKKPVSLIIESPGDEEKEISELTDILFDESDSPELEYLKTLIQEEMSASLEELPEEQRQAFELNEFQGKSFKEISEMTGVEVNTLISRKRYAVLYLREKLKSLYDELINF